MQGRRGSDQGATATPILKGSCTSVSPSEAGKVSRLPALIMHWAQSVPSCFLGSMPAAFTAPEEPTVRVTVMAPTERLGLRRSAWSMQEAKALELATTL